MKPCKNGKHSLQEITSTKLKNGHDDYEVVNWCKYCGAISVDIEIDGSISPGYFMKMTFPEICRVGCIGSQE